MLNVPIAMRDHTAEGASYLSVMDPTNIVIKGFLLKDNWYGNK